ncbi:unnamed protein product, partial [marine sediment metagenome]
SKSPLNYNSEGFEQNPLFNCQKTAEAVRVELTNLYAIEIIRVQTGRLKPLSHAS